MSKYCNSCGNEIDDNVKFCPMCGAKNEAPIIDVSSDEINVIPDSDDSNINETESVYISKDPFEEMGEAPKMGEVPEPVFSNSQTNENTYTQPTEEKPSIALAVASMVVGILSILCCCCGWFGAVLSITAIVLGAISIATKKGGFGMAVAGISCGGVALLLMILLTIGSVSSTSYLDSMDLDDVIEQFVDEIEDYM